MINGISKGGLPLPVFYGYMAGTMVANARWSILRARDYTDKYARSMAVQNARRYMREARHYRGLAINALPKECV